MQRCCTEVETGASFFSGSAGRFGAEKVLKALLYIYFVHVASVCF